MSIVNLGTPAVEAIQRLRTSSEWGAIKAGITEQMGKMMNAAIEVGTADACGYARALRDLAIFIEIAEAGPNGVRRPKPTPSLEHARRING